jgi:FlaA1/EpsC-like NDP-sugar epimerase
MCGGEVYVKKMPSMKITELATAISPTAEKKIIGMRPGEKLHEQLIGVEDGQYTYEYDEHFKILPTINNWSQDRSRIKSGVRVEEGFSYTSDNNVEWMSVDELQRWLQNNRGDILKPL